MLALAIASVTALVAASCGSGGSDATGEQQEPSASAGSAASPSASSSGEGGEQSGAEEPQSSAGAPAGGQQELTKLTVGYPSHGAGYLDLYVCKDYGVFEKYGLDVTLQFINSSSQTLAALISGSVQIAPGDATAAAGGIMKGVDLKFIEIVHPTYYFEMWASPELKTIDDLKGKKIGLSSAGSAGDYSVTDMLDALGWPQDAVQRVYVGSASAEVTALQNGSIDALVTQPPTGTQSREFGAHRLWDMAKYPAAADAYYVEASYLDKNRDTIASFVKANTECIAFLHDESNFDKAVESVKKHVNDDQSLAEYSAEYIIGTLPKVPTVDEKLIQASIDRAAEKAGKPAPEASKYIDNSFLDELEKSGFIDSLYQD